MNAEELSEHPPLCCNGPFTYCNLPVLCRVGAEYVMNRLFIESVLNLVSQN